MAQDPGPCGWDFPEPVLAEPDQDLIAVGADLEVPTVLAAYARGMFPMHLSTGELGWWSPDPRGILPLGRLHVSRSLRRSMRHFECTIDRSFVDVMLGCAERPGEDGWITDAFVETYTRLHAMGWAHSVEVWRRGDVGGDLVGGLYGVEIGGLFAGESMFHRVTDASKAALVHLVERLRACGGDRLLDVQWQTAHLASLGVASIPREDYLALLAIAVVLPACLGAGPHA